MPVVSIHLKCLLLIFSFLADETGVFHSSSELLNFPNPQTIALLHSSPPTPRFLSTYLSFLFCPFCFPAKLLNSSSVGCWYHRRLWTKKRRQRWNQAQKTAEMQWSRYFSRLGWGTKQNMVKTQSNIAEHLISQVRVGLRHITGPLVHLLRVWSESHTVQNVF